MTDLTTSTIKKRQFVSLVLNAFIVIAEIIGIILSVKAHGILLFQYYTQDSNIFALLACAVYAIYTVRNIRDGKSVLPQWIQNIKYMATCCLTVTFLVVIFVLSPMAGEGGFMLMLFSGSMLYHHLICPIVALLSFVFVESGFSLTRKHKYIAIIPTLIYAVVTVIFNIAAVMDGPYPFLHVYSQPVYMSVFWFVVILGGAYLIAWLLLLANRKCTAVSVNNYTETYSKGM